MSVSETLSKYQAKLQQFVQTHNITLPGSQHEVKETAHSSERYQAILEKYKAPPVHDQARKEEKREEELEEEGSFENVQEILKKYHVIESEQTMKRSDFQRNHSPPSKEPSPLIRKKREEQLTEYIKVDLLSPPQRQSERHADERRTPSPGMDEEDERVSFTLSQSSVGGFRMSIGHEEGIQTSRGEEETKMLLSPIKESQKEEEVKAEEIQKETVKMKTPKKMKNESKLPPPQKYDEMWDDFSEECDFKLDFATLQDALLKADQIIAPKDQRKSHSPPLSPILDASFSLDLSDDKEGEGQEESERKAQEEKIEIPLIIEVHQTPPRKERERKEKVEISKFYCPEAQDRREEEVVEVRKEDQVRESKDQKRNWERVKVQGEEGKSVRIEKIEQEHSIQNENGRRKEVRIRMSARRLASGRAEVRVWGQ